MQDTRYSDILKMIRTRETELAKLRDEHEGLTLEVILLHGKRINQLIREIHALEDMVGVKDN